MNTTTDIYEQFSKVPLAKYKNTAQHKDLIQLLNAARDWIEDTSHQGCESILKSEVRTLLHKYNMWDLD